MSTRQHSGVSINQSTTQLYLGGVHLAAAAASFDVASPSPRLVRLVIRNSATFYTSVHTPLLRFVVDYSDSASYLKLSGILAC